MHCQLAPYGRNGVLTLREWDNLTEMYYDLIWKLYKLSLEHVGGPYENLPPRDAILNEMHRLCADLVRTVEKGVFQKVDIDFVARALCAKKVLLVINYPSGFPANKFLLRSEMSNTLCRYPEPEATTLITFAGGITWVIPLPVTVSIGLQLLHSSSASPPSSKEGGGMWKWESAMWKCIKSSDLLTLLLGDTFRNHL